jgi:hypothetical protein
MVSSLCAVAAALALSSAASGRAHRSSCRSRHSNVVLADAQAEIYTAKQTEFSDRHRPLGQVVVYRGCVYRGTSSFLLGEVPDAEACSSTGCPLNVHGVILAKSVTAYELRSIYVQQSGEESSRWTVVVRDLRTGRTLRKLPTGERDPRNPLNIGAGPTTTIVAKGDGSIAWIVETTMEDKYEVHAFDKSGARVLATGPDIAPSSLALAGSTLYWTQGGRPVSVPLN